MVDGVGAAVLPVPPVAVVYHLRFVPVAAKGCAIIFWQTDIAGVTAGAAGSPVIFTTIAAR